MEEIYKDLSSPKSKEFEKLLNTEFSKSQISEGKIADGTITKITNKLVFIELPGAKSEGTLDINEMKLLKEVSAFVDELTNRTHWSHQPYVGRSAFAHKGGIHVNAIPVLPDPIFFWFYNFNCFFLGKTA